VSVVSDGLAAVLLQDLEVLKTKDLKNPAKKHGNIPL
jgi:hypothetical protein